MLIVCRWGYLNAFGVFQNYYKETLIPESSNSQISWIGSVQGIPLSRSCVNVSLSVAAWFRNCGKIIRRWIFEKCAPRRFHLVGIHNLHDLPLYRVVPIILVAYFSESR
jgi:hypothetical protein